MFKENIEKSKTLKKIFLKKEMEKGAYIGLNILNIFKERGIYGVKQGKLLKAASPCLL